MIFQEEVRAFVKRKIVLESNLATVYAVAWGQCSEDMKNRLKTHDGYELKSAAHDCVWLLQQIKSVKMQYDESTDSFVSLLEALYNFSVCKQTVGQSAEDYAERLVGWGWETMEAHGGIFAPSHKLIKERDPDGSIRTTEKRKTLAVERVLATALIQNADQTRYGTLITSLANVLFSFFSMFSVII